MIITSVTNEKIKNIKKLKNSKEINKENKILIEGEHLVKESLKNGLLIETISVNDVSFGVPNILVSDNVMKSISGLTNYPSVIGISKLPKVKETLSDKIIILDGVQDPGNLGTIIRSAKAFGFKDIILGLNNVKKYNEKVIRATQGMIFNTNIITKDLSTFIPILKEKGYIIYGTDVNNGCDVKKINNKEKLAVIMGSEGTGVSEKINSLVDRNIYIKMDKDCESLNVAVASSIIMYELGKK